MHNIFSRLIFFWFWNESIIFYLSVFREFLESFWSLMKMEILIQNKISMLADEMWNAYIQTILSKFKRQDIIMLLVSGWPVVKISSFLYKHQHSKNQIFLHHEEFVDNLLPKISRIRYKLYACTCTGCPSKKVPSLKEHFFWDTWYTYWPEVVQLFN